MADKEKKGLPLAGRIEFPISGNVDLNKISSELSKVGTYEVLLNKNSVEVLSVESRDSSGTPYKFFILTITPEKAVAEFSIPPDTPPKLRELEIIRSVFLIFSYLGGMVELNHQKLYQEIEDILNTVSELLGKSKSEAYAEVDRLKKQLDDLKLKLLRLNREKDELTSKYYSALNELSMAKEKLHRYESISDSALRERVIDWIKDHNGQINVNEFSKVFSVPVGRVESALDFLSKHNYIRRVD